MGDSELPFILSVSDEKLALLRKKLELTTFPDELENSGWEYGVPLADVKRLVERWRGGYDWRAEEARINAEMPQFTRDIEVDGHGTLNIHYVHKKSDIPNAIPLLFIHGWPGSFLEARKVIPLWTKGSKDFPAFHVVAVSLPGYGFSEGPKKQGFDLDQYAEVGHKLMLALGYNEYVAQGGDWGFFVSLRIASKYGGNHCKAWHTNLVPASPPKDADMGTTALTEWEKAGLERSMQFQKRGTGFLIQQSTQPQTLGYLLADSPAGLLAWIYGKLVEWTDAYPWEDDEVLTWVSIYWFSRAGPTASIRLHFEAGHRDMEKMFSIERKPTIPRGISRFPKDLSVFPKSWTVDYGPVVFDVEHEFGGHFAAHERPEDLVDDLRKMFAKDGPAYGVVKGKDGYA